jgi:ADP-ribose pyrophosphatase YjhB (NUDIX family)
MTIYKILGYVKNVLKKENKLNPRNPYLTTDCIIYDENFVVLIIRKDNKKLALPGGFVNYNESTEDACLREVFEETNLQFKRNENFNLFNVYSDPNRDPRQHNVSIVYEYKLNLTYSGNTPIFYDFKPKANSDAEDIKIIKIRELPFLKSNSFAFDHFKILNDKFNFSNFKYTF